MASTGGDFMANSVSPANTLAFRSATPVFASAVQPVAVHPAVVAGRSAAGAAMAAAPASTAVHVATAQATTPVLTAQVANMRMIDPVFARNISAVQPQVSGEPRSQLKDPVAPNTAINDEMLFEAPADASQKYYLPRYRVAQQNASGLQEYQITFEPAGTGFTLTIRLEKFAAPSLEQAAHTAHEIDHHIAVLLRHSMMINGVAGALEELAFQEITLLPDGAVRAALRVATLPERDMLYRALTESSLNATLVVRRAFTIAVPVSTARISSDATMMAMPMMALPMTNTPPLYRTTPEALDQNIDPVPFVFPPGPNANIFHDISPGDVTTNPGLIRHTVRNSSYYQNSVRLGEFYYLPDSFKIGRGSDDPHKPLMLLHMVPGADGGADSVQIDYFALPVVEEDRLRTDAPDLAGFLPSGTQTPVFSQLLTTPDKIALKLACGGDGYSERKNALVGLRSGIQDSLSLTPDQFQPLFDAMFGGSEILFSGSVAVNLPGGQGESIPFAARMNDLAGNVLDFHETQTDNVVQGEFQNVIESPVRITRLDGSLVSSDRKHPAVIQGLDFTKPVNLAPNDKVQFTVTTQDPISGSEPLHAEFDHIGVTVQPDQTAILNAILDPRIPQVYFKKITVQTFKPMFDANKLDAILVDFKGGESVELTATPEKLQADTKVSRPLIGFLLRNSDDDSYLYKVRLVHHDDGSVTEGVWTPSTDNPLIPTIPKVS
jgi:hypothetical protein